MSWDELCNFNVAFPGPSTFCVIADGKAYIGIIHFAIYVQTPTKK